MFLSISRIFNKNNILFIILFISIITISRLFISNYFLYIKQLNSNTNIDQTLKSLNITLLTPKQSFKIIKDSKYLNKMNDKDMKVRKCYNIIKCEEMYKNNLVDFSYQDKLILIKLIKLTNDKLKNYKSLNKIQWKFAKTTTKIEEGMPHTHLDTIFLSEDFFKTRNSDSTNIITLIHEKLHVYQRVHKQKTYELYNDYNFSRVTQKNINLRRANPDLDSFDYNYKGNIFFSEYTDDAKSLKDVQTKILSVDNENYQEKKEIENLAIQGFQNEHPNEIFASIISKKIVNNNLNERFTKYIS